MNLITTVSGRGTKVGLYSLVMSTAEQKGTDTAATVILFWGVLHCPAPNPPLHHASQCSCTWVPLPTAGAGGCVASQHHNTFVGVSVTSNSSSIVNLCSVASPQQHQPLQPGDR